MNKVKEKYKLSIKKSNIVPVSSNRNEVIKSVLNFLFFSYDIISQVQKSTKNIKKH